jgi:excisionase family DNA binding protein
MGRSALANNDVLSADPAEQPQLRLLDRRLAELEAQHEVARLVGPDGSEIPFPASAFQALQRVIEAMSRGASIALVPQGKELTTKQAADLLHVSRPFLVRQLLGKEIPFEKVGSHRRVRLEDVLAYRGRRARERQRLLDDMAASAQEVEGGYR